MMFCMRITQRLEDNEEFLRPHVIAAFLHPITQNDNQLVDWSGDEKGGDGSGRC
jgi:hypothetical protein